MDNRPQSYGELLQVFSRPWVSLVLVILMAVQLSLLRILPYTSSYITSAPPSQVEQAPGSDGFSIGPIYWNIRELSADRSLAPFRRYFERVCPGKKGLAAALALGNSFDRAFPFGSPARDCFDPRGYDPSADLQQHLKGQPGHCVTRCTLMVDALLSEGIPARLVQLPIPGHNVAEVWDSRWKWVAVDPSFNGYAADPKGPCSALKAVDPNDPFVWVSAGESPDKTDKPADLWGPAMATHTPLLYPEPWVYTRVGKNAAPFPFRAVFVRSGGSRFMLGPAQALLRTTLGLSLLLFILTVLGTLFPRKLARFERLQANHRRRHR